MIARLASLRIVRFGIVGVAATLTHVGVAQLSHVLLSQPPLLANVIGFLVAFAVSYGGHYHWTFESDLPHRRSLPRFLLVSLSAFIVSEFIVWSATGPLGMPMSIAMGAVAIIVPLTSYIVNHAWTFASALPEQPDTSEHRCTAGGR